MPAHDTEPENYSIDEMLDRLRARTESENGDSPQLVTRADGSQAYKVRKRKRRSRQPGKEAEKRKGRVQVLLVVAAGVVLVVGGLGFVASLVYLNSSGFRTKVAQKIEQATGSRIETEEFRVSPYSVGAKSLSLTWPQDSALVNLKVYDLKGEVEPVSFLSGPWSGAAIVANTGVLLLRDPGAGSPAAPAAPATGMDFKFGDYRSPHFTIKGGDPDQPSFAIYETEASLTFANGNPNKCTLQLKGGTASYPGWGTFRLNFASLAADNGRVKAGRVALGVMGADRSELDLENVGNVPLSFDSGSSHYEVKAGHVPLGALAGPGLAGILDCEVDTPGGAEPKHGDLTFDYRAAERFRLTMPFRCGVTTNPARAARLPMLAYLARRLNADQYANPKFELEAHGVVSRDEKGARLDDLVLETRGYIYLAGHLAVDPAGNLEGQLDVGLPDAVVTDAGPDFQAVFIRGARLQKWATVHISGTVNAPQDDLEERVTAAKTTAASGDNPAFKEAQLKSAGVTGDNPASKESPAPSPSSSKGDGDDDAEWNRLIKENRR